MAKPIKGNIPRLESLVGHGSDPADKSVVLRFQDHQKQFKTMRIGAECAGQTFVAFAQALAQLKSLLPANEELEVPAIHAVGIKPAMTEKHFALLLDIGNGIEVAVSMESQTHAKLLEQLQEAATKGVRRSDAN